MRFIERRAAPAVGPLAVFLPAAVAVAAALTLGGMLFLAFGADPLAAYLTLIREAFASLRGFGFTLIRAAPLALIALATVVAWRSGFGYLGFEGCFVIGAAVATATALAARDANGAAVLPLALSMPTCLAAAFTAAGAWAGLVGLLRSRFGGNEVLISLMSNYVALLFVQFLISGPMRAPGSLPQSERLPPETWLPFVIPGTRAHAGILLALLAAILVWALLRKTPLGYEMIVTGLNPAAARYGGIPTGRRMLLASFLAGGLGGIAGTVELLGVQHRLVDGMSGGVGFIGIVVALLARLDPLWVLPAAILYGGMTVGADAMQRAAGIPSSITFVLQSLIVLFLLASGMLRRYRLHLPFLAAAKTRRA